MSMVCFELSRELHEQEKAVRGIQIADADSLCNYLKGFWEFIYNHKMFTAMTSKSAGKMALCSVGFLLWSTPSCAFALPFRI